MDILAPLQNPYILCIEVGILSLLVGSFLNVVIYRLPVMMKKAWTKECSEFLHQEQDIQFDQPDTKEATFNLSWPPSHCPHCKHRIKLIQNIPVLSYLALRGRCYYCKVKISPRYAAVELLTALMAMATAWVLGYQWVTVFALLLTFALIAISFIDFDHQIIPDDICLPFMWLGLLINSFGLITTAQSAIIGAAAGYLILWSVFQAFKLLTGKEGMGYGDFKLLALFGAWLGWQFLPMIILISSLLGAVVGITLMVVKRHDKSTPIPFGPYLALAGWIAMLWGDIIMASYLNTMGL